MLTDEDLSLIRITALTIPRCCAVDAEPCKLCRVLRGVEVLAQEVARLRAGLPPPPMQLVPSELHDDLVVMARELTKALDPHTPMTPLAHAARSQVEDLLDEIARQAPAMVRVHVGRAGAA